MKIDIVVRFQGALQATTALAVEDVYPASLLDVYNRNRSLVPTGIDGADRTLVRMGQLTTTVRPESTGLLGLFVERIKSELAAGEPGAVCIYGSSSGGRNAMDLAQRLTSEGIPIALVAALDAAFFPADARNTPDREPGPTVTPEFPKTFIVNVKAGVKLCFFQTVGNRSKKTLRHGMMFTSNMSGQEVHGNVSTFTPQDMTSSVKAQNPSDDDDAHIRLSRTALPIVRQRIKGILDDL